VRIEADRVRLRYLLDEVRAWSESGLIHPALGDRLAQPYEAEFAAAGRYLEGFDLTIDRAAPPRCHEALEPSCRFCPDCGLDLASWRAWQARQAAYPPARWRNSQVARRTIPRRSYGAAAPVADRHRHRGGRSTFGGDHGGTGSRSDIRCAGGDRGTGSRPIFAPAPAVIAAAPVAAVVGTGIAEQAARFPFPRRGYASRLLGASPGVLRGPHPVLGVSRIAGSIYFTVYLIA
jgi:hypothetical protein